MKKYLAILGMLLCVLGLTACGTTEVDTTPLMTNEEAIQAADNAVNALFSYTSQGQVEAFIAANQENFPVLCDSFDEWASLDEEIGGYTSITNEEVTASDAESVTVRISVQGQERTATIDVVMTAENYESFTMAATYSFAEKMEKAALNTLIGMGTVFIILILISLIISCFAFIPKIQAALSKPKKADVKTEAVDNTISQIVEKEEMEDDTELVAVIAAAIAASEGTGTDGFVVRSIRKANKSKWQNA
ncbi:MAG: OadG family protein [Lachnospiraceae bacterium]|nr:OadG family protein [Lachnospiraceae bacterium]